MIKTVFVVAFTGPVGSGKTYIARILAKKLGALHIRADDIRVSLRRKGLSPSLSRVRAISRQTAEDALKKSWSTILDFDAVLPKKQKEIAKFAKNFGAKFILIKINTPEKIVLARLRKHRYGKKDLFLNSKEAIRIYFMRRKIHKKYRKLQKRPDFVMNNARPLGPQIKKIVKNLKG